MSLTRTSKRLVSLDVLRGITVCGMILVNNAGACGYAYAPLKHAKWDGFTPADLVFPAFKDFISCSRLFNMLFSIISFIRYPVF